MARVVRTTQAEQDLIEIWEYISPDSRRAADRLLDRIEEACQKLASFPEMGRRREELSRNTRSFPVGSYILFYRPLPDGVELLRVLHGARDVRSLFGRE